MTALIAAAAVLPAAVSGGIAWVVVRGRKVRAVRLRRRLFEVGLDLFAERDAALDELTLRLGQERGGR